MGQLETEHFCLKWNNHHTNMFDVFGALLNNESLCDVTLACDGLSLKAHKLVLSASSSFFQDLFIENTTAHPIVILTDLKYVDMKALVDFIYHGQVSVSETQLLTVLKAAKNLKIRGLGDSPEHFIHLDTGQSSQAKTLFLRNHIKNICKDNNKSSDMNQQNAYHSGSIPYADETGLHGPNQSESDFCGDNSDIKKSNISSVSQNDLSGLHCAMEGQLDVIPFKLMEQTMTTEGVFEEKAFMENLSKTSHSELSKNSSNDSDLAENSHPAESQSSDICTSKDVQCSNAQLQIEDHSTLKSPHTSSNLESAVSKDESSSSELGFSPFITESLSEGFREYSQELGMPNYSIKFPAESPKRGRKPGSRLCVLCKHVFNCESDLEKHMDDHRNKSECCDITDSKQLDSMDTTDSHDSQPMNEKNLLRLPLTCSTCKYVMNTLSDAQSHLSTNPDCRSSQFKCFLCPKIFIWPATLIKHFHEQHQGPDGVTRVTQRVWFFCDVCKKPLLSKHALSLHRSKFHGLHPHPFASGSADHLDNSKRGRKRGSRVCRLCKRTFVGSVDFITHLQTCPKSTTLLNTVPDAQFNLSESYSSTENESNLTPSGV